MTVFPYQYYIILLVGDLEHFSPIVGMMIQSDFHIFRGGVYHQPDYNINYQNIVILNRLAYPHISMTIEYYYYIIIY